MLLLLLTISCSAFADTHTDISSDLTLLRTTYLKAPEFWPKPLLDSGIEHNELGLLPLPVFPKTNPFSRAKVELGQRLFNDPLLSGSGQIACASCHDKDLGWADGRQTSFGHNRLRGTRNAPSIENAAYFTEFFWDGRADSLEAQALQPIINPIEMNTSIEQVLIKLKRDPSYVEAFNQVFYNTGITAANLAKAIATFERTIISRYSAFDRFLVARHYQGRQHQLLSAQLSDQALLGLHLFRTKARCLNCHSGPAMTDNKFHNLGLTYYGRELEDLGLYLTTGKAQDVGKFKTPSLRGVMNTKPWMHNGLFFSMRGVLNIYNRGGVPTVVDEQDPLSPVTSKHLQKLNLTLSEIEALEAFLEAITGFPANGPSVRVMSELEQQ
ncbi:cytochrome-c peroxidase [Endozoicomonas sp. G2_1]|uniref:cytochrome-c peroxidase n=1 Tax=Endozoicomonas sp. G2_1 TaxID=2821091 RepID=UPI001ADBE707|nr:cytochrome c peroxidase [Endozoicomonas sp. G2_1]MBO9490135.1 cytochrome-c peroxidase [Endozoicomonas sp. G2_1]